MYCKYITFPVAVTSNLVLKPEHYINLSLSLSLLMRCFPAPCAPQNVSRFLDCASNSLNVSWALGLRALNYTVLTRTTGGAVLSCTTTASSCIVTGLQCGQNYTAVITATNGECQGPERVTRLVQTGEIRSQHDRRAKASKSSFTPQKIRQK